jgi:hypothetical protein
MTCGIKRVRIGILYDFGSLISNFRSRCMKAWLSHYTPTFKKRIMPLITNTVNTCNASFIISSIPSKNAHDRHVMGLGKAERPDKGPNWMVGFEARNQPQIHTTFQTKHDHSLPRYSFKPKISPHIHLQHTICTNNLDFINDLS